MQCTSHPDEARPKVYKQVFGVGQRFTSLLAGRETPFSGIFVRAVPHPPIQLASNSLLDTIRMARSDTSDQPEHMYVNDEPDGTFPRPGELLFPLIFEVMVITYTCITDLVCDDDEWELPDEDEEDATSVVPVPVQPTSIQAVPVAHGGQARTPHELQDEVIGLDEVAMDHADDVDPFYHRPTFSVTSLANFRKWHPAVILATLLVSWLHLVGHLPFRFCDVTLTVIGYILAEVGQSVLVPYLPSSLTGSLSSLNLNPLFQSLPTCPACLEPHPESVYADPNACCSQCNTPLFTIEDDSTQGGDGLADSEPSGRRHSSRRPRWKPHLKTPYKSITEQLGDILSIPGNDDAMDWWRRIGRILGKLRDFFDARVSREVLGPDGKPFFRHDLPEGPDGELRIGLALGVDW